MSLKIEAAGEQYGCRMLSARGTRDELESWDDVGVGDPGAGVEGAVEESGVRYPALSQHRSDGGSETCIYQVSAPSNPRCLQQELALLPELGPEVVACGKVSAPVRAVYEVWSVQAQQVEAMA